MQSAADSAAIAGAQELHYGDVISAAQADSSKNGLTNGSNGVTVTVNNPPLNGPKKGNSGYVEVIVSQSERTFFLNASGLGSMTVNGRAVAALGPIQNCFYELGTSGTDISISGGSTVSATDCGFLADSSSSSALSVSGGSTLNAGAINLVGNYSVTGGSHITPSSPATGITPVSDPLGYLAAPSFLSSSCVANPNIGGGATTTIGPSTSGGTICYNGLTIGGGAHVTLKSGLYIINNGAFSVQGGASITGSSTTFYLAGGGSVSIGNGASISLTAPTSGTYDGILFYQNRSNSTAASITGGTNPTLNGILYFPDAGLTLTGGSSSTLYTSVISSSITFSGGSTMKNYADINSSTPLSSARLVE